MQTYANICKQMQTVVNGCLLKNNSDSQGFSQVTDFTINVYFGKSVTGSTMEQNNGTSGVFSILPTKSEHISNWQHWQRQPAAC